MDEFWTAYTQLFTAQFPTYYTKPQKVWGRLHSNEESYRSEESYLGSASEIVPLKHRKGKRTYIMMHPFVYEPILTFTVGLHAKPKHYADQESSIGRTIGQPKQEGVQEIQVGNAQAWYYHEDKTIVLWECFFDGRFQTHPFKKDNNMRQLWERFESWLIQKFPDATTIATPFNDPIAQSIEEYQSFLKTLGYTSVAEAAFGKQLQPHTL
jgi:hypothetical protein